MSSQRNTRQQSRKKLIQTSMPTFLIKKGKVNSNEKAITKPTGNPVPDKEEVITEDHFSKENVRPTTNNAECSLLVVDNANKFKENEQKGSAIKASWRLDENNKQLGIKESCCQSVKGNSKAGDTFEELFSHNPQHSQSQKDLFGPVVDEDKSTKISSLQHKKPKEKMVVKLGVSTKMYESQHYAPRTTNPHGQRLKTKRAPNEIQVASLVFPVLIREQSLKDLRQELDSLSISKPFSFKTSGFQESLEEIGLKEINIMLEKSESQIINTDLKTCFYCGFATESSLVLGSHLDKKHKNRFKQWPFSKRMDFKLFQGHAN